MNPIEPRLDPSAKLTTREVIEFLRAHPDFFVSHPDLLADLQVPHLQSGQAVSLVERQAAILRERIKSMELKLAELLRHGQENDAISNSIQKWVRGIFLHQDLRTLPTFAVDSLGKIFTVPLVGVGIWQPDAQFENTSWVISETSDFVEQIDGLKGPVCGAPNLSAATRLLPQAGVDAQSIALIPLRVGAAPTAFGVMVLGSPDARRFAPDLGVAFLERMSEIASAALSRVAFTDR